MRCISVYTKDFALFSDLFEDIMRTPLADHEEKTLEGIVISDSGETDVDYLNRLKVKPEVVVMRVKDKDVTILQHGDVFDIFIPGEESMVH